MISWRRRFFVDIWLSVTLRGWESYMSYSHWNPRKLYVLQKWQKLWKLWNSWAFSLSSTIHWKVIHKYKLYSSMHYSWLLYNTMSQSWECQMSVPKFKGSNFFNQYNNYHFIGNTYCQTPTKVFSQKTRSWLCFQNSKCPELSVVVTALSSNRKFIFMLPSSIISLVYFLQY